MSVRGVSSAAFTRIAVLVLIAHCTFATTNQIRHVERNSIADILITKRTDCQVSRGWLKCTGPVLPMKTNEIRLEWSVTGRSFIIREDFKYSNHFVDLIITGKTLGSIESGTFEKMNNLVNLTVTFTEISVISSPLLRGLDSLERLDLSNNRFNKLNDVIPGLIELANLRYLSLANNQIINVTKEAVDIMSSLSEVDLTNNPLRCDCGLMPLRPYILDYRNYSKQRILFVNTDFCCDPVEERNATVANFMMHIYNMHCSSVSELMFTVYFVTTALLCAGFLYAFKEMTKRLAFYLIRQPITDKRVERKDIKNSGLQVNMPLLDKTSGFVDYN